MYFNKCIKLSIVKHRMVKLNLGNKSINEWTLYAYVCMCLVRVQIQWMCNICVCLQPEADSQSHAFRSKVFKRPRPCNLCHQPIHHQGSVCRGKCITNQSNRNNKCTKIYYHYHHCHDYIQQKYALCWVKKVSLSNLQHLLGPRLNDPNSFIDLNFGNSLNMWTDIRCFVCFTFDILQSCFLMLLTW